MGATAALSKSVKSTPSDPVATPQPADPPKKQKLPVGNPNLRLNGSAVTKSTTTGASELIPHSNGNSDSSSSSTAGQYEPPQVSSNRKKQRRASDTVGSHPAPDGTNASTASTAGRTVKRAKKAHYPSIPFQASSSALPRSNPSEDLSALVDNVCSIERDGLTKYFNEEHPGKQATAVLAVMTEVLTALPSQLRAACPADVVFCPELSRRELNDIKIAKETIRQLQEEHVRITALKDDLHLLSTELGVWIDAPLPQVCSFVVCACCCLLGELSVHGWVEGMDRRAINLMATLMSF